MLFRRYPYKVTLRIVQGELEKVLDYLKDRMKEFCGDNFDVTKSQPPSKVKFS